MKRILFFSLLLSLTIGVVVAQTPYERRNTFQGQAFFEDINIWVYTTDFARRFGMPTKWVDDSLRGAKALAFRVETVPYRDCGLGGGAENCSPFRRCMLDAFLESSVKLPWKDDRKYGRMNRDSVLSIERLWPQDPEEAKRRHAFGYGLANTLMTLFWSNRQGYKGIGPVLFERDVFGDLNFFSLQMACTTPPRSGAEILIQETGGQPTHTVIRDLHLITLPDSFTSRLFEEWRIKHDQARTSELHQSLERLKDAPVRAIDVPGSPADILQNRR